MTQALLSGAAIGALYALMTLGFALSLEIAEIVNAAHGAFVVGAMYITLELHNAGVSVILAVLLAAGLTGAGSYVIYSILIRPARAQAGHGMQLIFTLLLFSALMVIYQLRFGADLLSLDEQFGSVRIFGGSLSTAQVVAIVLAVVIAVTLYLVARFTMLGKVAYVASRYPLGARSVGVPVERIYKGVFVLSGVLAGLAGGVVITFQSVEPVLALKYLTVVFLVGVVARTHLLWCLVLGLAYGIVQSVLSYSVDSEMSGVLTVSLFLVALVWGNVLRTVSGALPGLRLRSSGSTRSGATTGGL